MRTRRIPNVHAGDIHIPAGKVQLGIPGAIKDCDLATRTVLETRQLLFCGGTRQVMLEAVCAGWAVAGSALRWDNGYYGVRWMLDGASHGRRYSDYADAKAHFDRLTG